MAKSISKDLLAKYQKAFHSSYLENASPEEMEKDILILEQVNADHPFKIDIYETDKVLHLKIYQYGKTIPLSDILPMLENMDLRTLYEQPYRIRYSQDEIKWLSDFTVVYNKDKPLNLIVAKQNFCEALTKVRFQLSENDGFNKLVLGADLNWREVMIFRAYAKYVHQTGFRFSQAYIEAALSKHTDITRNLLKLFQLRHDPNQAKSSTQAIIKIEEGLTKALDAVTSLDEDRIIRRFWDLIRATVRTNYYQTTQNTYKNYLSFKFESEKIPELPKPYPLYEIFVYAVQFEGIHLRKTKVARGGLRWSDRREDFRTEILGLMKAQYVKNAIIVPSGAKGGFVLKSLPPQATKEIIAKEVLSCYQSFIRGLLDLTDNLIDGKFIRPKNVVCYDEPDHYLVVAADKGTATFSDIANAISKEYNFWLGDAFASGGSTGYDHKKMGITARGTWESIKRHFRELEINILEHDISVVGIGDMSGDVFGNGMIYSKHLKLLAAFDHRDIFLDPNPNPITSYNERLRLFNLPFSSWQDYNKKLISKGGGIFSRASKAIVISPEVKKILDISDDTLTPNELIRAILKAPVDLLFNGGIGTYVKASNESNADAGDRTNDFCRINGNEIRAKVVGEGGNLGFTQLGRDEYALQGGLINTDFIDNSAGVDCSDHEVNAKILLDAVVRKGKLTEKKRNALLAKMTEEVAALVLKDNYDQAFLMSFASLRTAHYAGLYQSYLKELETSGIIDRVVEFLPDDKKILERKAAKQGLTRPELAVIVAYSKIYIKQAILNSDLPEDPYLKKIITSAFPKTLSKHYGDWMEQHSLRREIIATQLSNELVNEMGVTFVYRLQTETGANISDIIKAHTISAHIFRALELEAIIESFDFKFPVASQYEFLHNIRHLINLSSRWFLRGNRLKGDLAKIISHYSGGIEKLKDLVPNLMSGVTKEYLDSMTDQFMSIGLPKELARRIAGSRAMYTTLNIIEVATDNKLDLIKTAKVYFQVGGRFNLVWFRDEIAKDTREGHWITLARLTLRDELDVLQKLLTVVILRASKEEKSEKILIEKWVAKNQDAIARWTKILELLHGSTSIDYSMFFIALREFANLIHTTE